MHIWVNVPRTQTSIFVFFLSAGVLFDDSFSLWLSLYGDNSRARNLVLGTILKKTLKNSLHQDDSQLCLIIVCDLKLIYSLNKDTHREKPPSNKTPAFTKSMNMGSRIVVILNQFSILKLKQNFQKYKVVTGKILFFMIRPLCTHHSICLNICFWHDSLYGNVVFQS